MKIYLTTIAASCIMLSLTELIAPDGRTKNCVIAVISIAFAAIVFSPLVKSDVISLSVPVFSYENSITIDENAERSLNVKVASGYASDIKKQLLNIDLVAEDVKVEYCRGEIQKIEVYLSNLVISEDDGHINNNVIADYVSKELGINRDRLFVYG